MQSKTVGEIHKLSSGDIDVFVTVNFEHQSYEIADYNKPKSDDEFIREAACYARNILITHKDGI